MKKTALWGFVFLFFVSCRDEKKDYLVKIKSEYGEMTVLLYEETPAHKKNFLALAKSGAYDSTIFHRVIQNFMIQGGDVSKKTNVPEKEEDRIPSEIRDGFYHVRGALAAARQADQINPEKKSSSTQFYIVDGNSWEMMSTDIGTLNLKLQDLFQDTAYADLLTQFQDLEREGNREEMVTLAVENKALVEEIFQIDLSVDPQTKDNEAYKRAGGGYHYLDGEYTVFGRVVEGLEVIDKIAAVEKTMNPSSGQKSQPITPIHMTMEIIEVKKKEISEKYGYQYPN